MSNRDDAAQRDEVEQLEKWDKLGKQNGHVFQQRLEPQQSRGNMFATLWGNFSSGEILQAFRERGVDAGWFAAEFKAIWDDPDTSNHMKVRLMNLQIKIMAQHEGQTVTVNGPSDRETKEVQVEYDQLVRKLEENAGGQPKRIVETRSDAESGADKTEQGSSRELHSPGESGGVAQV